MKRFANTYYDRYRREIREERVYAGRFLFWLYNTPWGRVADSVFFRRRLFSVLYGLYSRSTLSRRRIESFVEEQEVDLSALTRPLNEYRTFRDFFVRSIDPAKRPVNGDPSVCVSPVDGKVLVFDGIGADLTFRIKRTLFNLRGFLRDEELVRLYAGGTMFVFRLTLADYHHFHFPDAGTPGMAGNIPGCYFAGGPYAHKSLTPFYKENHRMVTLIDCDNFSRVAMVEVGALTVGSIIQTYSPGLRVGRGEEKGYFEPGGSTVVLLFRENVIEPDEDLRVRSEREEETYLHLGDSIGRRK